MWSAICRANWLECRKSRHYLIHNIYTVKLCIVHEGMPSRVQAYCSNCFPGLFKHNQFTGDLYCIQYCTCTYNKVWPMLRSHIRDRSHIICLTEAKICVHWFLNLTFCKPQHIYSRNNFTRRTIFNLTAAESELEPHHFCKARAPALMAPASNLVFNIGIYVINCDNFFFSFFSHWNLQPF
jgi:hypothetical protein